MTITITVKERTFLERHGNGRVSFTTTESYSPREFIATGGGYASAGLTPESALKNLVVQLHLVYGQDIEISVA